MRNSATYGTQLEIVAFARMYKRKIKVIQAELIYVIGFEDESPNARAEREAKERAAAASQGHARKDSKGKMKEVEVELPDLYIVYHNWEVGHSLFHFELFFLLPLSYPSLYRMLMNHSFFLAFPALLFR